MKEHLSMFKDNAHHSLSDWSIFKILLFLIYVIINWGFILIISSINIKKKFYKIQKHIIKFFFVDTMILLWFSNKNLKKRLNFNINRV
jgi:hypothetical protein